MWFRVGDKLLRLSIRKWCLITRLKCGKLRDLEEFKKIGGSWRIHDVYFDGNDEFQLQELDTMFDAFDFTQINDKNALRIALFYFMDRILCARPNERPIHKFILYVFVDLKCFNNFSWGTFSWNIVYNQMNTSLNKKAEKSIKKKKPVTSTNMRLIIFMPFVMKYKYVKYKYKYLYINII